MVRNLEERLGVRLAERTTRSIAPTAAGERLLERVRPVLDEYQSALESMNEFRGRSSRPIPWKTPAQAHRDLESRKTVGSTVLTV
jgi:DNA-binding transcriptional LysR family regulator